MRALQRKLWRDAWHYRGQLTAIVAVVLSGMALFVALRSLHGYLRRSRDSYYRTAQFADVFANVTRAPRTIASDLARLPGVHGVEPRQVHDVVLDVPGLREPATGRLVSIPVPRAPMFQRAHANERMLARPESPGGSTCQSGLCHGQWTRPRRFRGGGGEWHVATIARLGDGGVAGVCL